MGIVYVSLIMYRTTKLRTLWTLCWCDWRKILFVAKSLSLWKVEDKHKYGNVYEHFEPSTQRHTFSFGGGNLLHNNTNIFFSKWGFNFNSQTETENTFLWLPICHPKFNFFNCHQSKDGQVSFGSNANCNYRNQCTIRRNN